MTMRWLWLIVVVAGCQRTPTAPAEPPLVTVTVAAREASPGKQPPLMVLLHGLGANEQNLLALADSLDPRFELVGVRAPLTVSDDHYGWFHTTFTDDGPVHDTAEAERARLRLVALLQSLRSRSDRIYLLGFSQGAMMALSVALLTPAQVRGVVAISGGVLDGVGARSSVREGPPVLLLHGTQDPVIPYGQALLAQGLLRVRGFPFDFKSYEAGHEITQAMRADLRAWSTAQLDP